jgi:hypothetical protein
MATGIAEEIIKTSVFVVRLGASADHGVLKAPSNAAPTGISGEYPKDAPLSSGDPDIHARVGDQVLIYNTDGTEESASCLLRITATVARGAKLMPDATGDGSAITATTGKYFGAEALESGVSGQRIRVRPVQGLMA